MRRAAPWPAGRSERIVDAAEHRDPAAGQAEIHVADDEGIRHAAYANPGVACSLENGLPPSAANTLPASRNGAASTLTWVPKAFRFTTRLPSSRPVAALVVSMARCAPSPRVG